VDQAFKTPMACTSGNGLVANEGEVLLPQLSWMLKLIFKIVNATWLMFYFLFLYSIFQG